MLFLLKIEWTNRSDRGTEAAYWVAEISRKHRRVVQHQLLFGSRHPSVKNTWWTDRAGSEKREHKVQALGKYAKKCSSDFEALVRNSLHLDLSVLKRFTQLNSLELVILFKLNLIF
jgi:hypothetical protein